MTVSLSPVGGAASQFFNSGGVPLYGGKIYTYEAGTTTPKATYTEANGLTAHPNPIILNSAGRVPGGEIWLTSAQAYLFILKTSSDETIGTYDNIYGINAGAENAVTETQVATAGQTDFVLTSMAYTPGVFTLGVYIDGVNQVVNNSYVETSATTVTFVSGLHAGALVKFININSAATDANAVTYLPAGMGAVSTTVQAKLRESVSVKDFGATGDGVTDDTAAIQAAVTALPAGGILTGLDKTYVVTCIKLKSNMTLKDFKFLTKGGAIPSEFWSPVTIGGHGDTSTYSDIDVINVHVNGQRLLNGSDAVGMSEDGGRHGFRIIGNVANVRFLYCSAKYCGSYGFFFYRGLNTAPIPFDDVATISNVKLIGCVSQYNKAHGGAADSINEFTIDGGTYTHNGLDYFSDPGAKAGGKAYSCGFDFEGYGIGSWTGNVLIQNADMRHNASESLLFVDPVDTLDARFRIRDTIVIQNNQTDTGSHPDRLNPYSAIIVTAPYANFTHGSIYKNVSISGGNTLGEINYACVDDLRIDTPQTVTRGILGEGAYSNRVECVTSSKLKFSDTTSSALTYKREVEYDEGSFTPVISSGSGSITSYTAAGSYVKIGKLVTVTINYTITTNGTGAAYGIIGSLPFSASVVGGSGSSRVGGTTGEQCSVSIAAGNTAFLWTYSNAYPWANGANGSVTMSYITA